MKGPHGYGRYDDDPKHIGCPRAHSDMTPCIARDGGLALADDNMCVGCYAKPGDLLKEIGHTPRSNQPKAAANTLRDQVRALTEPAKEEPRE